jgi:hypothetical protein
MQKNSFLRFSIDREKVGGVSIFVIPGGYHEPGLLLARDRLDCKGYQEYLGIAFEFEYLTCL